MLDDASGNPPGTDPGTRGHGTWVEDPFAVVIDFPSDDGSDGDGDDRGLINAGLESNDDPDSTGNDRFSVDFGNIFDDGLDDKLADGNDGERELSFGASSEEYGELDVDLSPWAPLLGMLDSTEPEASANDRPFTPSEGVKEAHALELRAESMLQYCERGAERTGKLDRTEVGVSDDNRDIVAGRDHVEIDGMLEEHTGHGLVYVADDVEMNVAGPLRVHAHLEDNIIMAGVMTDEWKGGTFITAAMSDDMAAGLGLRCTAPLDVWVHGLVGMEERPGTCAADGILHEIAGTLYEREYGPSAHVALVARHSGTVVTTMKTRLSPPDEDRASGCATSSRAAAVERRRCECLTAGSAPGPGWRRRGSGCGCGCGCGDPDRGGRRGCARARGRRQRRHRRDHLRRPHGGEARPRLPLKSRTCSTPRAPPTTSTIWPGSTSRGRGTNRSQRSTSNRSQPPPCPSPTPPQLPARARAARNQVASPRRSIAPRPGPTGTTSARPTDRSATGTDSTAGIRTGAETSSCASTSAKSTRRRSRCSRISAARPMELPATVSASAPQTSTQPWRRWPGRRRWPADWRTWPASAARWTSSRGS